MTKAHTGAYLASRLSQCLHAYGIQDKVRHSIMFCPETNDFQTLGLVLDNASNNDTLIQELPDLISNCQGSLTRIRCFAHVLNLVVKVYIFCN